jgi:hypothetical protein
MLDKVKYKQKVYEPVSTKQQIYIAMYAIAMYQ